ncbi:PadR family transcriptional regulator [Clostridium magnum]|uniref:Transcriptional regulator PadR-like family protein n=1 Tax=Clostridium magnum DSM 2767 TaxID=1121326 RepID=A0A162TIH7_9CLOT|nr:PadR family transcriptional regulator [Clostridium magnum]KZL92687.1 transcriptional regulator PadR-like family protein [Clostridium magnum DSM 2767]SHI24495.1 DNA-binding transcriptional regulator, PadR family [Clostridium magnum DSM 2767]
MAKRYGRHTPAFLLLQLAYAPAYGGMLMKRLENELPYCFSDSAMIYRSLKDMESDGLLETTWETKETGKPVKWYNITKKGLEMLDEFAEDIRKRHANFEYFLSKYHSAKLDSNK